MYVTGSRQGVAHDVDVVHLVRAHRMVFPGPAEFLDDPGHRAEIGRYLSDMVRPHGLKLHENMVDGHSYGEMAEALINAVVPADEPVDLLILAFAIHDVRPGRATATYLSHVCPGTPMAFAICDQGSAAAFTGLRLVRDYLFSGGFRRALLLVVEQATLPYDAPTGTAPPAPVPARHAGVALLYAAGADASRPRTCAVRQHADVPPGHVGDLLAAEVAQLSAGRADALVVLGTTLAAHWPRPWTDRVRLAPEGQPYTGVWWEFADSLAEQDRPIVLAEYDPVLGYLCLSAIDHG